MKERSLTWIVLGLTLLFLIGPFIVVFLAALSAGDSLAFPPQGLSLRWFIRIFQVESFRESFFLSGFIAIFATLASLVLGIPAAYAMNRYRLKGSETINLFITMPLIVPGIVVGLALLRYIVIPFGVGYALILFLAHTVLVLPYSVRVVSASLQNLRSDMEEAAVVLGCTRFQAFRLVVLPNLRAGVMAAFILGFVTSFNQVPVSLFLSGPGVRTLPIDMLAYIEDTFDPSVAALAALLAFLSIAVVFAAERFLGFSKYV